MTMEVRVRFRFNKVTGEVEEFIVDDVDSRLPADEHNRQHERIATEIGRVIERNPGLIELQSSGIERPGSLAGRAADTDAAESQTDDATNPERSRIDQRG
jgi:hypothetical protein